MMMGMGEDLCGSRRVGLAVIRIVKLSSFVVDHVAGHVRVQETGVSRVLAEQVQGRLIVVVVVAMVVCKCVARMCGSIGQGGIGRGMLVLVWDEGLRVLMRRLNEDLGRSTGNKILSGMHVMRYFWDNGLSG